MNIDKFWNIIDEVNKEVPYDLKEYYGHKQDYFDKYIECLKNKLRPLDFGDIIFFENVYDKFKNYLWRYDFWYECAWMFEHSSDDGFAYFLAWIMSRGKKFYFDACYDVKNMENLSWEIRARSFEELDYVCDEVIEEKWPEVYKVTQEFIRDMTALSLFEEAEIEKEVKETFKNGVNDEESSIKNSVDRMWKDEAMIKRWDEYYRELGIYENEKSESEKSESKKVEIDKDDLPF